MYLTLLTLLIALASVSLLLLLSIELFFRETVEPKENRPRGVPNRLRDGVPRRAQMVRNRGARLRAYAALQQEQLTDDENEERNVEFPNSENTLVRRSSRVIKPPNRLDL